MSYDARLYRREVMTRETASHDESLFENDDNLLPFTTAQRHRLHERLLHYGYTVVGERDGIAEYVSAEGPQTLALLTDRALYFQGIGDGIFEAQMTASEFADDEDFAKYDPQQGLWEEV